MMCMRERESKTLACSKNLKRCTCILFRAKRGPLLGLGRDRMASMATFRVPSKISFLLAKMNQAPSPALRISNMVSYIYEEPW